jgi:hypothetical protein
MTPTYMCKSTTTTPRLLQLATRHLHFDLLGLGGQRGNQRGRLVPVSPLGLSFRLLVLRLIRERRVQCNTHKRRDEVRLLDNQDDCLDETVEPGVRALVREDVGEPVGHAKRSETEGEACRGDESVTAGPLGVGENTDAGDRHGPEEECGEATDGAGSCEQSQYMF